MARLSGALLVGPAGLRPVRNKDGAVVWKVNRGMPIRYSLGDVLKDLK